MTPTPDTPEIRISVPPRVYAKLKELAGYQGVENWARNALVAAAEEASPALRDSGMWRIDTGAWYSLLNPADDEEAEAVADGILTEGQVAVRRSNEGLYQ